jgi:uncharacterized membrane protein YebE (DUF533 family)
MDPERLIGGLIEGALLGRRGRGRALRRLTGGSGSLLNASNLLAAAGLVWGLYEAAQGSAAGATVPPPLPASGAGQKTATPKAPDELRRIVQLTISAAGADGDLSLEERGRILDKAREIGAEELVTNELRTPRPLSEIVAGVSDPALKRELYTLAFTIARSDDGVTGAERIYLAQLANQLGLDPATTRTLEDDAQARGGPKTAV